MRTFKTYDFIEVIEKKIVFSRIHRRLVTILIFKGGSENWGIDSPIHALKKESNWLEFVQLVPFKDPVYEKDMSKIKQRRTLDEFILSHNRFLGVNNDEVC